MSVDTSLGHGLIRKRISYSFRSYPTKNILDTEFVANFFQSWWNITKPFRTLIEIKKIDTGGSIKEYNVNKNSQFGPTDKKK